LCRPFDDEGKQIARALLAIHPAKPQISGLSTDPMNPTSNGFNLTITGSGFDSATSQVVLTGPTCESGCVLGHDTLTVFTATTLTVPVPRIRQGSFTVSVLQMRNGSPSLSNSSQLIVNPN
jgi:hypothetical protein